MADDICRSAAFGFETRAIRAGQLHDASSGAVVTPIRSPPPLCRKSQGFTAGRYSRTNNPTRQALRECLASLEGAAHGLAFASGMSAEAPAHLVSGDHIVLGNGRYGGTFRLISAVPRQHRLVGRRPHRSRSVAGSDAAETKIVWVETPTNPLLTVVDIAAIPRSPRRRGPTGGRQHLCDAVPPAAVARRPMWSSLDHQILRHHSDVVGGFLATNDTELADRLAYLQARSVRLAARSTTTSPCEVSRRWQFEWTVTVRMPRRLSSFCSATTRSPMCSPVCPITRAMLRRPGR